MLNELSLALQLGDKHRITTPVNWNKGDDVIVHPTVTNDEAKTLFPEHTVHKVCFDTIATRIVAESNIHSTELP